MGNSFMCVLLCAVVNLVLVRLKTRRKWFSTWLMLLLLPSTGCQHPAPHFQLATYVFVTVLRASCCFHWTCTLCLLLCIFVMYNTKIINLIAFNGIKTEAASVLK